MAGSQISTSVTIIDNLKGYNALSLTEYTTSAAAQIAAGSVIEIAGAFYTFTTDETINASSWTAITTGTNAYITLTPSGTAGSQIVEAAYTSTAPTWRDDLQGWYASAGSNVRVVGVVYKAEATSYYPKYLYNGLQDNKQYLMSSYQASVSSSLSVGGQATITGSATVGSVLSIGLGIRPSLVFHKSGPTIGSIFTAISTYIPTTGQTVIVNGSVSLSGIIVVSYAERISSTRIHMWGLSDSGASTYAIIDSGSASVYDAASFAIP